MSASPLRRWLRRQPHPTRLRVDGRDVAIATGAQMWVVTEESVLALNPSRVEAIDGNGVMLRALMLDRDDDQGDDQGDEKKGGSEIVQIARLLAEAHDSGARRHAEAYALAFSENTKLVGILAARLGGLETAWQKAMQQTASAQAQALMMQGQLEGQGEGGGDPAGQAIGAMLANAFANGGAATPKANGAPKKGGTS